MLQRIDLQKGLVTPLLHEAGNNICSQYPMQIQPLAKEGACVHKKLISMILLLTFVCACSPTTALIKSEPPGATVFVDGKEIGMTPVQYSHNLSRGAEHNIQLQHQGFETVDMNIKADKTDSHALKRWLTAGLVWSPLWLGTLFTKKLKESYMFVMKRNQPQMTASAKHVEH